MTKFLRSFFMFVGVVFVVFLLVSLGGVLGHFQAENNPKVKKDSILEMKLDGVIINADDFLEDLERYAKKDNIKGVLIRINSPGGIVGPSQEIYREIKRVRDELQKPVVAYCSALAASGAYYAAVAADHIVTNPGTMLGSIGVIMEFANLQGLYSWAKIERFSVKTGPFKDSGAEYRPMRADEKQLFQDLVDGVHRQFKLAVKEGRKLDEDVVNKYSDGRVFTGEAAVKMGFADSIGNYVDAVRIIGDLTDLGDEPEIFSPPKRRPDLFEMLAESGGTLWGELKKTLLVLKTSGQPLYMMPGAWGL